jgi:putative DNA primase/helicase
MEGVLAIAASLEAFAATVDDIDADLYLFNCADATLDLRTMETHPHTPADRITKVANAAYDPDALGPEWDKFLQRVLPNENVRGFLQRYLGTALCGRVLEHKLAILTGVGRNGKGSLYGAVLAAMGDYAAPSEPGLFTHREGAHPTGQMDLRGRRFTVVSENDKDVKLAEATVKRLTGGDRLKARYMGRDFVEFAPSHTPVLVTNHLPRVSGDDPALWARLRVIPFDVVIPDNEQDGELPAKLELEADAILTWIIQGWQQYRRPPPDGGLAEPEEVTEATWNYQQDSDPYGRFVVDQFEKPKRFRSRNPMSGDGGSNGRTSKACKQVARRPWVRHSSAWPASQKPVLGGPVLEGHFPS